MDWYYVQHECLTAITYTQIPENGINQGRFPRTYIKVITKIMLYNFIEIINNN